MGYSPWGHKESDMTEQIHFTSQVARRIPDQSIQTALCFAASASAGATVVLCDPLQHDVKPDAKRHPQLRKPE